jgi:pilus assembly protein FimV
LILRLIQTISISLLGLLMAGQALALSLGNLTIQSKPDQALKAEIAIQVQASELENIKDLQVALSDPEIYQRLGISSSATQAQLKVSLLKGSKQEPLAILISSDDVLKLQSGEVFLDALVELRWSTGLVRRVYTLMVADQAKVEVKSGDTLTEIAVRALPNFDDANLDQALIALYRVNPQAFAGGSIHRLKAGAELTMPSKDMVQSVPKEEAKEIVTSADQAYRSGQAQLPLVDVTKPTVQGDRLKVGPAEGLAGDAKRQMEELLVQEKSLAEAKQKIVELEKNIADLKSLIQNSNKPSVTSPADWKTYMGPIAIAIGTLIALMVLLKLSKSQSSSASSHHEKQSNIQPNNQPNNPKTPSAVPPQAAKLFASLDLNIDPAAKAVVAEKFESLPSAETLRVRLNLSKAYITIEDFKAARLALNEILTISNQVDPEITIQAQSMLAELDQRNV